jgi:hypothetical protein
MAMIQCVIVRQVRTGLGQFLYGRRQRINLGIAVESLNSYSRSLRQLRSRRQNHNAILDLSCHTHGSLLPCFSPKSKPFADWAIAVSRSEGLSEIARVTVENILKLETGKPFLDGTMI